MLNRIDHTGEIAIVRYLPNELQIVRAGRYVRCAVSGALIALEELRYWNVDLQEAYASPELALERWRGLREA